MNKTKMYVLTETSLFMMSYVIITKEGNAIIIDGGRPEDVPLLREKIKGHPIKAWFLTHPHFDHVSAFNYLVKEGDPDFDFERCTTIIRPWNLQKYRLTTTGNR
jgi:glyoxylase-like metal-dependent hydrolase (beta-lactamase superfamily II)